MKELEIKFVFRLLQESKRQLSDLRNSGGPVTSGSLDKVEPFLMNLEEEIVSGLPKKRLTRKVLLVIALGLLLALGSLLREIVPEAVTVVVHLLLK